MLLIAGAGSDTDALAHAVQRSRASQEHQTHVVNLTDRWKPMELYWPAGLNPRFPPRGPVQALMKEKKRNLPCSVYIYIPIFLAGGNPSRAGVRSSL